MKNNIALSSVAKRADVKMRFPSPLRPSLGPSINRGSHGRKFLGRTEFMQVLASHLETHLILYELISFTME